MSRMDTLQGIFEPCSLILLHARNARCEIRLVLVAHPFGFEEQHGLRFQVRDAFRGIRDHSGSRAANRFIAAKHPNIRISGFEENVQPPRFRCFVEDPVLMLVLRRHTAIGQRVHFAIAHGKQFERRKPAPDRRETRPWDGNLDILVRAGLAPLPQIDRPASRHAPRDCDVPQPPGNLTRIPWFPYPEVLLAGRTIRRSFHRDSVVIVARKRDVAFARTGRVTYRPRTTTSKTRGDPN